MYRNRSTQHLCMAFACMTQVATAALQHGNIDRDSAGVPALPRPLRRLLDSGNETMVHAGETTAMLRETSAAFGLGTTPVPVTNFSTTVFQQGTTAGVPGSTTVLPGTTPGPHQNFSTTAPNLVTTTAVPGTTPGPDQNFFSTPASELSTTPGPNQKLSTTTPNLVTTTVPPETTPNLVTTTVPPETTPTAEPTQTQQPQPQPLPTSTLFFKFRVDYTQADFTELLPAFKKAMQLTLGPKFTQVRVWIGDAVRRASQASTLVSASVSGPAASIRELAKKIQSDSPSFLRALNEELTRQSLTAATLIRVSDAQGTQVTGLVSATSGDEDDYLVKLKTHVLVIIFFGTSIGVSVVSVVIYATRRQCWLFQDGAMGRDTTARREATIMGLAEDTDLLPTPALVEVDLERAVSPAGDGLVNRRSHRTADPV